ncbi:MAG: P-type DNA transfer ATPase VirB11 [Azoarcus sp.]|jgi:type IV secretion system protein VirB11|nr:P-type DNA transfer ATPase VirB11 [Azoarcus sp.]
MNRANDYLTGNVDRSTSVNIFLGPLRPWLDDAGVSEVCVNRPGEVFAERGGKWERHGAAGLTFEHLDSLGIAVSSFSENEFSDVRPILSAVLPNGERIQVVRPPACEHGTISVTIRKPSFAVRTLEDYEKQGFFRRVKPISDDLGEGEKELMALKADGRYMDFLRRSVQLAKVIIIAGETGSGKTTFMKSLMQDIPARQRLITIEDVPELFLPNHPNHVHLFYPSEASEEGGSPVTSASLLKSCLRMKPDRILLAELRGAETFDFVNVCASGHAGSITSCHAGSAELTFERLALMILQNRQGRTLPYEVIRRLLYLVVDVVVHVHNDAAAANDRHITEIWYDPSKRRERSRGAPDLTELFALLARTQNRMAEIETELALRKAAAGR